MKRLIATLTMVLTGLGMAFSQTYTVENPNWGMPGCTYEIKCYVSYVPTGTGYPSSRVFTQTIATGQVAVFNVSRKGYVVNNVKFSAKTGTITHNNLYLDLYSEAREGNCMSLVDPEYTIWECYEPNPVHAYVYSSLITGRNKSPENRKADYDKIETAKEYLNAVEITPEYIELKAFPNPVRDQLSIETNGSGRLMIVDQTGRTLMDANLEAGTNQLNTKELPAGLYHMIFTNESEIKTLNLIKQ